MTNGLLNVIQVTNTNADEKMLRKIETIRIAKQGRASSQVANLLLEICRNGGAISLESLRSKVECHYIEQAFYRAKYEILNAGIEASTFKMFGVKYVAIRHTDDQSKIEVVCND